ncbi:MAG TPA: hypothetical protein VNN18_06670 [Candidatus Xenobia bacterium]|nr:hypothetical protein [Candidatus Xenobia bacterium]
MRCPSCGRKLNRAEQLWLATHGSRECPHCWGGVPLLRPDAHAHPHGRRERARVRRGDRRMAA